MNAPARPDRDRQHWATPALLVVIAVGLALRLYGLDYSLWYDEIASTKFARVPLRLLWSDWMVRETNPPLYYSLLGGWSAVVGQSDVALRLLSVVIGGGAMLLVFGLGRRVGEVWTGVLAAALVAASAQNILYSQQVRGYVLAFAAATLAIAAALAFLEATSGDADGRRRALAGYVLGGTVAVYAHTTLVTLPALTGVFVFARLMLGRPRAWTPAIEWAAANAVILLLWTWWARITVLQAQSRATIGWIDTPSLPYAVRMTLEAYVPWQIGPAQYVVAALAVLAAAMGSWHWRHRPDRLLLPFLAAGLPALLYLLSLKVPVFLPRTVYWGSAPFLVTVAAGVTALRPRALAIGAAAIGIAASLAGWAAWFPAREIEPWRGIVAAIEQHRPHATVLVSGKGPALAMRRYCQRPRCSLDIVALSSPTTDAWVTGFVVPGVIGERAAPELLRRRGALVAVRWMTKDPMQSPPPGARGYPLAIPPVHENNIGVTLWQAAPGLH